MYFVGIDVSKATLDVASLEAGGCQRQQIANRADAIAALVAQFAAAPPILIVLEATGVYHLELLGALAGAALPVSLVNPVQVTGFRQTLGLRTKTDRVDARLLAQFAQTCADQLRRWTPQTARQQELAGWMTYRDQVVKRQTQLRGHLEAARYQGVASIVAVLEEDLAHAAQQRSQADAQIEALLRQLPQAAVLLEMVGVGLVTAAAVLAWVPQVLWGEAKAAAAYAGVCPQVTASGQQARSHLSQHGHRRLRRILYCAARVAVKHDPRLRAYYERLVVAGKPAKQALCAAMHKLLRWMMGRLRAFHRAQAARAA
jgi:transposase